MLIALGSDANYVNLLPSQVGLGSEEQFFSMVNKDAFNAAMAENNSSVVKAAKAVLSRNDLAFLRNQVYEAVAKCGNLKGRVVLGTHNPWLQFLYDVITECDYNGEARELDYIIVDVVNGQLGLVETNLLNEA